MFPSMSTALPHVGAADVVSLATAAVTQIVSTAKSVEQKIAMKHAEKTTSTTIALSAIWHLIQTKSLMKKSSTI
jgi:hypothetical protein